MIMNDVYKIHVGELIKKTVKSKGIKVSWLASQLNCHRNNIYKICEKQWLDTHILMQLSRYLNHDFFMDLSKCLKETQDE